MKPLLDVLIILDALEKEGSFAAASAKLYKTPSALSYTVHRLESDLNIQILDRSGHRARFTRTGQMLLEKGREVLHTVRELEKQAIKLHEGWENELVIGVDDTFPFSLLAPLIESFYQHHSVTRLKFINGVLGGSWDALIQGRADIIVGAMHEPPSSSDFSVARLGELEQIFAVAPHHPLAEEAEPLSRSTIKRYRAIVVGDSSPLAAATATQLLDDQEAITVFDFKTKLELQISGLGCGYLPRYLAQRFLDSGALIEKKVAAQILFEPVWMGWNEQTAGLASAWWRDAILANSAIAGIYKKDDSEKSNI
ncbi:MULTISPECIES: LysR family transcriptional regulator [Citrobacter]|jgi:DNA-binding transcriptional LysR family regulator|uniref:LysR family transcriptional regulator n=1 Tax=Citrobacter amalonaticus TaxID=35703 RepID=A0A8I0MM06_CITAM|nr:MULTISPECIES: LysR family transcriptional regulator [Citrobacter]HAT6804944.1 LysR family transcriptional regulator [Citrobacter freundii]AMG91029.1 LysR family transcriptional regulator [Citrobacter amalonaticus]AUO63807.1 LysR family transcriptional regulator [Citrobacter freundii complex sp. CFNIH2]EKW2924688.1 LysR family transcriptional regulator [Citrobacter amalonaticus]MBE0129319.1 LysR family transcriptional regulator [Citrobacter amalonaticus]